MPFQKGNKLGLKGRPKGSKDTRPRITRKKTLMIEDKQQSGGNCTRKMH